MRVRYQSGRSVLCAGFLEQVNDGFHSDSERFLFLVSVEGAVN
jgi:hypothetical protein